ncbi:unnamed protein product [Didymodactylos carnosus]|uniref:LAGLIDADG homing endonuclease n=1 Tax=Didymodactylos carnosus TaxID=1234261 RepID=A0A8S2G4C3_9BILA|nr:unnamed protein product [Didymodactylos carnosus]CAF4444002.1 unnamed protein product [Didymodactylos carnosus]
MLKRTTLIVLLYTYCVSGWFSNRQKSSNCREYFGSESTNKLLVFNLAPLKNDLQISYRSYISSDYAPNFKDIKFVNYCCFILQEPRSEKSLSKWRTDMKFYGGGRKRQLQIERYIDKSKTKQLNIPPDLNERNILLYSNEILESVRSYING